MLKKLTYTNQYLGCKTSYCLVYTNIFLSRSLKPCVESLVSTVCIQMVYSVLEIFAELVTLVCLHGCVCVHVCGKEEMGNCVIQKSFNKSSQTVTHKVGLFNFGLAIYLLREMWFITSFIFRP